MGFDVLHFLGVLFQRAVESCTCYQTIRGQLGCRRAADTTLGHGRFHLSLCTMSPEWYPSIRGVELYKRLSVLHDISRATALPGLALLQTHLRGAEPLASAAQLGTSLDLQWTKAPK